MFEISSRQYKYQLVLRLDQRYASDGRCTNAPKRDSSARHVHTHGNICGLYISECHELHKPTSRKTGAPPFCPMKPKMTNAKEPFKKSNSKETIIETAPGPWIGHAEGPGARNHQCPKWPQVAPSGSQGESQLYAYVCRHRQS